MEQFQCGEHQISIYLGDITEQDVDCIVNAANNRLTGGGGVDGAIHRQAGPELQRELNEVRNRQGGCPTGKIVVTSGGRLAARWIIHTVGPIYRGRPEERELLASCYREACHAAVVLNAKSIAFPSISTGAYGYPILKAVPVAVQTVLAGLEGSALQDVRFVLFSQPDFDLYQEYLRTVCG